MATKNLGAVTAYAYAKAGGYTGTEEEFQTLMAALPDSVEDAQAAVSTVTGLTAQATKVASTAPASATYNKIANRIDFKIPEGNGIASVTLTSTSGAVKTYTITFDDGTTTTFNVTDGEVTQEVFEEAITELDEKKANYDGYYDEMTVGTAEQLISSATIEDDELYVFRSAGGTMDIGNRETDMLVGGTVAWNQLIQNGDFAESSGWTATYGSGSYGAGEYIYTVTTVGSGAQNRITPNSGARINSGHKYLISATIKSAVSVPLVFQGYSSSASTSTFAQDVIGNTTPNAYTTMSKIIPAIGTGLSDIRFAVGTYANKAVGDEYRFKNFMLVDLTLALGSTIADYIYSLEQAEAGKGVAWFRKYFPKPYYAYNAGSLQSVNVASHDMTGFNQWDEEWELGYYNTSNGNPASSSTYLRSKSTNYIDIIGGADYYFCSESNVSIVMMWYDADKNFISYQSGKNAVVTAPSNARYGRFYLGNDSYGTTYKNDICINRVWTGYRNGEYEEYVKHSYPYDESVELRGIPQLVDGELKYDGDTYESSGKVTRKYGIVDLGTLDWLTDPNRVSVFRATITGKRAGQSSADRKSENGVFCGKYVYINEAVDTSKDKYISDYPSYGAYQVFARDTAYTDATAFKTAMSGVYLVYPLATPTEETADPFTNPQICDDFGTEEYVDAGVKNNTRDVAIPVGHVTQYMANLRDKLQHLPSLASSDGDYLVNQSGTSMSLKPIAPYFNAEHPNLTAGSANQLLSTITIEDQTPYHFRTSGGSVDIGDRETDMIVGGTIAWNQLIDKSILIGDGTEKGVTFAVNTTDGTITLNGTATETCARFISGAVLPSAIKMHRFLVLDANRTADVSVYNGYWSNGRVYCDKGGVITANGEYWSQALALIIQGGTTLNNAVVKLQVFDLTQMFGSTIADYIYSLETANAGAGVAYFRSMFPKPYYAYNAGELLSVSGLQSHDMVGFNQLPTAPTHYTGTSTTLDKTKAVRVIANQQYQHTFTSIGSATSWRVAFRIWDLDGNLIKSGSPFTSDQSGFSWNLISNIWLMGANGTDKAYKFSFKQDCYVQFYFGAGDTTTSMTEEGACFHLVWDGERDGEYEPYTVNSYALDDSLTLRGIPKLDASNNLYYDGDTYESDGTVRRKCIEIVLDGSDDENWIKRDFSSTASMDFFHYQIGALNSVVANAIVCDKYPTTVVRASNTNIGVDLINSSSYSGAFITFRPSGADDMTTAQFRTLLSQNPITIVYELATPTTESAEPYTNPQIVDDFGTEEYVTDSIVPVGHVTQYQPNLRAKLEMAPNSPDGDGDYIVRQTNGTNEYVELVIPKEVPDAPAADGTYIFKVTVSNGTPTYDWVPVE